MEYFCSFTSGSKGNSGIYVRDGLRVLIDAGTSARYIISCLARLDLTPADLTHICITHSHTDHVSALPVLLKHSSPKLVCTYDTACAIGADRGGEILFEAGDTVELDGVEVATAATPHDCPGSCCYSFGSSFAYATDMGAVTADIYRLMSRCRTVFIESNHDVDMLREGPYPYYLKSRILSPNGHLSNADCACTVSRLVDGGVERVMLGHLSETNNLPSIAIGESRSALKSMGADDGIILGAAGPRTMGRVLEL